MPRPPLAHAWIVNLRWLYAFFRRRFEGLLSRFALRSVILWLRIVARKICRALPSSPQDRNVDANVPGLFSGLSYVDDHLVDAQIQVLPSMQAPVQKSFDVAITNEAVDTGDVTASNDTQLGRLPRPTSGIDGSDSTHSQEGSATLNSESTASILVEDTSAILDLRPIFPEAIGRYCRETMSAASYQEGKLNTRSSDKHSASHQINQLFQDGIHISILKVLVIFLIQDRIFTDINLYDAAKLISIQATYYAALLGETPHPDFLVDLVIDEIPNEVAKESEPSWGYYFVNHSERCPFWLHPLPVNQLELWHAIQGTIEKEQLRHDMERQYWSHCTMFPNAPQLTPGHISELKDCLVYSIGDVSTSLTSTAPYSVEELRNLLALVEHLQVDGLGSVATYARIMDRFAYDRFLNFHGLPHARLDLDQSVYDAEKRPQWVLFCALSFFLFFAPEVYLQSLEKAYTDKTVLVRVWKPLIHKLNTEWQDFTLLGTVVLNVNVSFLSITSVDTLTMSNRHSIVQILSYLSIVASIGSIILGLLLIRQNRTKFHESANQISASVDRRTSKIFGLELLALIFALPYALLTWSMITFFVALIATCMRAHDTLARSTVGAAACITVLLVGWIIYDAWSMQDADRPPFWFAVRESIRSAVESVFDPAPLDRSLQEKTRRAGSRLSVFLRRVSEKNAV
ncbi:hypothetical protein B0H13DRAFT_2311984 [Mycena leptocephala]|nr:hypothetical protein B0H13DRAFT_2311984 [Mycena leptocephala]